MKKQIIFIHGGTPFENIEDFYENLRRKEIDPYRDERRWSNLLSVDLGDSYEVFLPKMPVKENADYKAWKIWFEKYFPFIKDESPILIGHSLGGTFLLKYLSENGFSKAISQLHLVSPAVFDDGLTLEKLSSFHFDIKKINKISEICKEIHLWHSKDDNIVPLKHSESVKENLPSAEFHVLNGREHFNIISFPEILEVIKKVE